MNYTSAAARRVSQSAPASSVVLLAFSGSGCEIMQIDISLAFSPQPDVASQYLSSHANPLFSLLNFLLLNGSNQVFTSTGNFHLGKSAAEGVDLDFSFFFRAA